VLIYIFAEDTT